jgi:ABC-type uncharacterized transport system ATPase subunit
MRDPHRSRDLLMQIASQRELNYFEIRRPSLHEIFVKIAGPQASQNVESQNGK